MCCTDRHMQDGGTEYDECTGQICSNSVDRALYQKCTSRRFDKIHVVQAFSCFSFAWFSLNRGSFSLNPAGFSSIRGPFGLNCFCFSYTCATILISTKKTGQHCARSS